MYKIYKHHIDPMGQCGVFLMLFKKNDANIFFSDIIGVKKVDKWLSYCRMSAKTDK